MYTTEYTCKVITPMFLNGADNKTPEFRAPSIKGAMRFWWRAVNASIDNDKLIEREKIIFGGINNTSLKSSFSIDVRVAGNENEIKEWTGSNKSTPHKNCDNSSSCIPVDTSFTVRFSVKKKVINKIYDDGKIEWICGKKRLEEVEKIFELMTLCGGLGKRSRRGYGAFSIIEKNKDNFNNLANKKNIRLLIHNIREKNITRDNNTINKIECSTIPLKTGLISIQLGKTDKNANNLLVKIKTCSHNTRKIEPYENILAEDIDDTLGHIGNERLASPVIVSVVFLPRTKKYRVIITTLCSIDNLIKSTEEKSKRIQTIQNKFIADLL